MGENLCFIPAVKGGGAGFKLSKGSRKKEKEGGTGRGKKTKNNYLRKS